MRRQRHGAARAEPVRIGAGGRDRAGAELGLVRTGRAPGGPSRCPAGSRLASGGRSPCPGEGRGCSSGSSCYGAARLAPVRHLLRPAGGEGRLRGQLQAAYGRAVLGHSSQPRWCARIVRKKRRGKAEQCFLVDVENFIFSESGCEVMPSDGVGVAQLLLLWPSSHLLLAPNTSHEPG